MSEISVSVETSGPLFDGTAEAALGEAKDAIERKLAQMARNSAKGYQLATFKVQTTGDEPASLHVEKADLGHIVTDAHQIVYGPWLEGTGSRNETTRFKGYHTMRIVASETDAIAESVANEVIKPYIDEMN